MRPGPLGNRPYAPTAALAPISEGLQTAASNLVEKARRALEPDPARARRFIERAVRVPFDDHEEVYPGVVAAHFSLYMALSDAVDELEVHDRRWVAAALEVYRSTNEVGREELADALAVLVAEGVGTARMRQEIRTAIGDRQPREMAYDDPPVGHAAQCAYIEAVLRTRVEFESALAVLLAG